MLLDCMPIVAVGPFGLDTVILPKQNEPDLEELPEDVRNSMTFILVEAVEEVLQAALLPAVQR